MSLKYEPASEPLHRYGVSVHALLRANHASRGTIFARDLLRIPQANPGEY